METDFFAGCEAEGLQETIDQLHGIECLSRLLMLRAALAIEAQGGHLADGAGSAEEWLRMRLDIEIPTAREWVGIARKLETLPALEKVFESGRISWDKLKYAVELATPQTDAEWAKKVISHSCYELRVRR